MIRKAGSTDAKKVFKNWKKLSKNVGENPDIFLRHYCIAHYGKTSGNELYRKFMQENPNKEDVLDLSKSLASASKIYMNLLNPTLRYFGDREILNEINALKSLQSTVFLPILLCAKEKRMKNKHFKKLSKMCVSLFVRYKTIMGYHPTKLETLAINTCKQIRAGKKPHESEIKDLFNGIMPTNNEFKRAFLHHTQPENKIATYLLRKIFSGTRRDLMVADPISLEHVIPQDVEKYENEATRPDNVIKWERYMNTHNLTVNDVYRLGNMALLLAPDNSEAGDKIFRDKKLIYKKYSIPYTKEISKLSAWNRKAIDSRQEKFANRAIRIWKFE
ncbi:MAG: HNH endonuclease [Thaumarchaeota archaeon]|nr:HNH endonuclease [Nitrososphaerota archaeon]